MGKIKGMVSIAHCCIGETLALAQHSSVKYTELDSQKVWYKHGLLGVVDKYGLLFD